MGHLDIRPLDVGHDIAAVEALDTCFTTDSIFAIKEPLGFWPEIELVPVTPPASKCFPIDVREQPWAVAYTAWLDDTLAGFVAGNVSTWNARLVVSHFYVDQAFRRRGVGRGLMDRAAEGGRAAGATTVWVETSNLNHPGIEAYQRLGFAVCGFDLTLYAGTPSANQFAIFLARTIPSDLP